MARAKAKAASILFIAAHLFLFFFFLLFSLFPFLWSNARLTRLPPTDNLSPTDQHAHAPPGRSGRVRASSAPDVGKSRAGRLFM